jgi:hypothetical protein
MISEGQRLFQSLEGYTFVLSPIKKERLLVNIMNSFVCADSVAAPTWAPLFAAESYLGISKNRLVVSDPAHTKAESYFYQPITD